MSARTRAFVAGLFAVFGVFAAAWMVFGPKIEQWWKMPKSRPIERVAVDTALEIPNYTAMTGDDAGLAQALTLIESALRDRSPADSRVRTSLNPTDRAEIAQETAAIVRVMLSGSVENYKEWLRAAGAEHPILSDPSGDSATRAMQIWTHNGAGLVGSPVDPSGVRMRVRFFHGEGPFNAPEDDILFGWSAFPARFPKMPESAERMTTIVEAIVPVMYVNHEQGNASNTLLGFWMARYKPGDPWRLWRVALYDFERPSRAWVPVY